MRYNNITRAIFLDRPNRFIANVDIEGYIETVHVKNTGRCKELLIPGCEVWLNAPGTPGRKTKYDLVAVRKDSGILFNIDSQAPNKIVKEWLQGQNYDAIVPEYTYGNSRIDFYMTRGERGVKHLRELTKATKEGYKSILAFVIQMDGVSEVRPNIDTHPEFGTALAEAKAAGVEVLFLKCHVEPDLLEII